MTFIVGWEGAILCFIALKLCWCEGSDGRLSQVKKATSYEGLTLEQLRF
jgi:hypothetical protein